jgi:hypothetical protein
MLHFHLRGEPPQSSAHWAVGRSTSADGEFLAVIVQIGDAKGEQARKSLSAQEARDFAENIRSTLNFTDRMTLDLEVPGHPVRIVIHREDGLEMAARIDAKLA